MDPLQLWEEFRDRLSEDYTHRGVPVERAYLEGLADIHFVLRWHGFTLSSFNLPEQGVPVRPEVDVQQNLCSARCSTGYLKPRAVTRCRHCH